MYPAMHLYPHQGATQTHLPCPIWHRLPPPCFSVPQPHPFVPPTSLDSTDSESGCGYEQDWLSGISKLKPQIRATTQTWRGKMQPVEIQDVVRRQNLVKCLNTIGRALNLLRCMAKLAGAKLKRYSITRRSELTELQGSWSEPGNAADRLTVNYSDFGRAERNKALVRTAKIKSCPECDRPEIFGKILLPIEFKWGPLWLNMHYVWHKLIISPW